MDIITGQSLIIKQLTPGQGRVYGSHTYVVQLIPEIRPGGHQVFRGVYWHPYSHACCRVCYKPLSIPMGAVTPYSWSGVY